MLTTRTIIVHRVTVNGQFSADELLQLRLVLLQSTSAAHRMNEFGSLPDDSRGLCPGILTDCSIQSDDQHVIEKKNRFMLMSNWDSPGLATSVAVTVLKVSQS